MTHSPLLYKCQDLNLNPQHPYKKPAVTLCTYPRGRRIAGTFWLPAEPLVSRRAQVEHPLLVSARLRHKSNKGSNPPKNEVTSTLLLSIAWKCFLFEDGAA